MCACKMLIFISFWLKFRINIVDLNVWSYKETCQRRCEGGYSHAVALTHLQMRTHRYFLGVKATVTHHAPTGGGASHWLPQGWQADDSAHSVAAAKDRLQKLENSCLLTTNTNCGFTKYSALIDTILTLIFAQLSTLNELNNCWKAEKSNVVLFFGGALFWCAKYLKHSAIPKWKPINNHLSRLTSEDMSILILMCLTSVPVQSFLQQWHILNMCLQMY